RRIHQHSRTAHQAGGGQGQPSPNRGASHPRKIAPWETEMTLWGGRFAGGRRDPHFENFSQSFSVDRRLIRYDLRAHQAYVKALGAAGVLTPREAGRLKRGLQLISRDIQRDANWSGGISPEDVHTWVEERLEKEIGPLAGKLRTGRSRNDLVATEAR